MDKLEPRLRNLIEDDRTRAVAAGTAVADVEDQPFQVTISHQDYLQPGAGADEEPTEALQDLEQRVQASQAPILAKLEELGALEGSTVYGLTNAVTATLTPAQLSDVAELDEVKLIRHERLDAVTTMNESVRLMEAPETWEELGYNGRGIRVGQAEAHGVALLSG